VSLVVYRTPSNGRDLHPTARTHEVYPRSLLYTWLRFRAYALKRVYNRSKKPVTYLVTGMSLGAALGALSYAFPLNKEVPTRALLIGFGAPQFGNDVLYTLIHWQVSSIQWFANVDDPVPLLLQRLNPRYTVFVTPTRADASRENRSHRYYLGVDFLCSLQAMGLRFKKGTPKGAPHPLTPKGTQWASALR
jgi:hypothetical protein